METVGRLAGSPLSPGPNGFPRNGPSALLAAVLPLFTAYMMRSTLVTATTRRNLNMRPLPTVLFHVQPLIPHAQSITEAVQRELSTATYEYLSAQPVDTLIQHLYTENQIFLPHLRRDQISFDHFEDYLSPYIDPPLIGQAGQRIFKDTHRGMLFAFDVGFVGKKRFFNLKPSRTEPSYPLAHVGENTLTIYIPQRNRDMPQIEQSFEETISLIELY